MCSRTRSVSGTFATCSSAPRRSLASWLAGGQPNTAAVPESAFASPSRIRTAVVFPAPFGPNRASSSPRSILKSIPRSASIAPYRLVTRRNSATGMFPPPVTWCGSAELPTSGDCHDLDMTDVMGPAGIHTHSFESRNQPSGSVLGRQNAYR